MTTNLKIVLLHAFFLIALASEEDEEHIDYTKSEMWGYSFLTGFALSSIGFLAALLLVAVKKCVSQARFKLVINFLYALGLGALLGDALVHILPQSFHNEELDPKIISLILICSIFAFLLIERAFEACGISHQHWGEEQSQHTPQKNPEEKKNQKNESIIKVVPIKQQKNQVSLAQLTSNNAIADTENINDQTITPAKNTSSKDENEKDENDKSCMQNLKGKGSAGYFNLVSSLIHNFIDGLAIGIAFSSRERSTIIPVIIAVFCHQIPRQLGDVGILMKNGFSGLQTILCNGVINFISLIGLFIGVAVGEVNEAVQMYFLVFVAGNFIYISADIWRHLFKSKSKLVNVFQFVFFALGVGVMFAILYIDGHDHEEEQHDDH